MAGGLFALLDDIAALAKAAASSIDDVAAGAAKASAKSAGVIIDDTAVTPQYVQGLSPARELPVIWRISRGSLINKFFIIIPIAMVLSTFAPQVLPWLLLAGGTYLSFEGALKVAGWFGLVNGHQSHTQEDTSDEADNRSQEDRIVRSAITTDLVLSTEIMLIAMDGLDDPNAVSRLMTLIVVAIAMTALVYGVVAVLVKLDDVGLRLAGSDSSTVSRFGYGLANGMPATFQVISVVGTVAMLWVGGHLVAKSLSQVGLPWFYGFAHALAELGGVLGSVGHWFGDTVASFVVGLGWGAGVAILFLGGAAAMRKARDRRL